MPKISLVVCLYKERDLLERLLHHCDGLYDDLVVVHDGPEEHSSIPQPDAGEYAADWLSPEQVSLSVPGVPSPLLARDFSVHPLGDTLPSGYRQSGSTCTPGSVHELTQNHGGRFFEGPRCFQQEAHWPFAWSQARHDWMLRLDADEFPSNELADFLRKFRNSDGDTTSSDGYTCIWPPWNGKRASSINVPEWRPFLINRSRISFFGMPEQGPIPDSHWDSTGLILHHQPRRISYGVGNLIFRRQAYTWRHLIAQSLLHTPIDLPRWRWDSPAWPRYWEEIRRSPIRTALKRATLSLPLDILRSIRHGRAIVPYEFLGTAVHRLLVPMRYYLTRNSWR